MRTGRVPAWLTITLAAVALVLAIPALWIYVSVTATPLYPNAESVPTVMATAPLPRWANAVERGRQIVRAGVAEQNLPGVSVAVGADGEVVWAEGFGLADVRTSARVTPGHRFRIGTASIALTAAAAGLLLEDGRLRLDDEIQKHVPQFPRKQAPITLRQLMGHTAGIVADGGDQGPLFTKHCESTVEALRYFAGDPLLFPPGTRYRFSPCGWILMSAAIEAAAGRPFLTYVQERIFDPLGMRDTIADTGPREADDDFPVFNMIRELIHDPRATRGAGPEAAAGPDHDQVTSYFPRFAKDPNYGMHLMRPLDYSCYAGAGAFLSTPSDLVRFGMAVHSGKLLQPATVALLQAPQRLPAGGETGDGLGWQPMRAASHDGETMGGMVASLLTFPERGIVVAVTSNISHAGTHSLAVGIAAAFAKYGGTHAAVASPRLALRHALAAARAVRAAR